MIPSATEAIMAMIWTDPSGKKYELKHDEGEWWYRIQGEGNGKWKKGHPPGWFEKGRTPLDQR
jgi:hypothetical protein